MAMEFVGQMTFHLLTLCLSFLCIAVIKIYWEKQLKGERVHSTPQVKAIVSHHEAVTEAGACARYHIVTL